METNIDKITILEEFETSVCFVRKCSDGIIKIVIKDKVDIDIKESREMFEIIKSFATKKELLVLVITGKDNTITKEVREFSGSDEASSVTYAEAVVVNSLSQKLIVNFILQFHKPKRKMKMFTREEEALKWLYGFQSMKLD